MNLLFLDFETYYDSEYSLRKMTPAEYIDQFWILIARAVEPFHLLRPREPVF